MRRRWRRRLPANALQLWRRWQRWLPRRWLHGRWLPGRWLPGRWLPRWLPGWRWRWRFPQWQQNGRRRTRKGAAGAEELFPLNASLKVLPLSKAKFPDASSKHLWLIIFYDNGNEGCAWAKPTIQNLADKVRGTYKVGAVNCQRNQ